MSDLLQVIIDFNLDKLTQSSHNQVNPQNGAQEEIASSPLQILFDSLIKFLNAFQLQSALNRYRIYLALPKYQNSKNKNNKIGVACKLIFPDGPEDECNLQKFAFETVRETIYNRVEQTILEQLAKVDQEEQAAQKGGDQIQSNGQLNGNAHHSQSFGQSTSLSQAFLKAICHAKQHQAHVQLVSNKPPGEQDLTSSRIFVVQMDKDDPTQYAEMVNGIFAAQKLKIVVDTLVLKDIEGAETKTPYLMIQASQQTGGVFRELSNKWCHPQQGQKANSSILFFELMNNFLPSPVFCRDILRVPTASQLEQVKMSSTCICHDQVISIGYACANCLALHCFQPVMDQLKDVDQGKREAKKSFQRSKAARTGETLETFEQSYLQRQTYPKLQQIEIEKQHKKCKNCGKSFLK